jgi:hypothetical protein
LLRMFINPGTVSQPTSQGTMIHEKNPPTSQ